MLTMWHVHCIEEEYFYENKVQPKMFSTEYQNYLRKCMLTVEELNVLEINEFSR